MSGPYPSGSTQPSEVICPYCDARNMPSMNFCGRCGKPLAGASTTTHRPNVPQQPQTQTNYPPTLPYDRREQPAQGTYATSHPQPQTPYYNYAQPSFAAQNAPGKSLPLSIFLTLFFGPMGLFYATTVGGIIMVVVAVVAGAFFFASLVGNLTEYVPFWTGSGPSWVTLVAIGIWAALVLASTLWGATAISAQNKKSFVTPAR